MATLRIEKVTALPADANLVTSTLYIVASSTDATKIEMWVTSKTGGTITKRRVHTATDIATIVLTQLDTEIGDRETDLLAIYNTAKA